MIPAPLAAPAATTGNTAPADIIHTYCECDEDTALCGKDLRDAAHCGPDDGQLCVVCEDLCDYLCDRCDK